MAPYHEPPGTYDRFSRARDHLWKNASDSDLATTVQFAKYRARAGGPVPTQSPYSVQAAGSADAEGSTEAEGEVSMDEKDYTGMEESGFAESPAAAGSAASEESTGVDGYTAPEKSCESEHSTESEDSSDAGGSSEAAQVPVRGVVLRRDGLVDLETPEDVRQIVEQNAGTLLLRLPGEVRNLIWEYALGGENMVLKYQPERTGQRRTTYCEPWQHSLALALPRVCRQIYAETNKTIYAHNTFSFSKAGYPLKQWSMDRLPAQYNAVRRLQMHYNVYLDQCCVTMLWSHQSRGRLRDHFPVLEIIYLSDNPQLFTSRDDGSKETYNVIGCNERSIVKLEDIVDAEGERGNGKKLVVMYCRYPEFYPVTGQCLITL